MVLPDGEFEFDVIDTWNMTVEPVPGVHHGVVRVGLPARQHLAVRLRRVDSDGDTPGPEHPQPIDAFGPRS